MGISDIVNGNEQTGTDINHSEMKGSSKQHEIDQGMNGK
jgi:hypothetical protein